MKRSQKKAKLRKEQPLYKILPESKKPDSILRQGKFK
jgi:hypothetical protein